MTAAGLLAAASLGEPLEISVRELLNAWGYVSRGPAAVAEIGEALAGAGLTTEPPFATVADMRETVRVVPAPAEEAGPEDGRPGRDEPLGEARTEPEDVEVRFPPVSLCVHQIPSACGGVVSVGIDDSLQHAQTLMMRHDYSQLAVVDGGALRGAVTWESISAAKISGGGGGELRHYLMGGSPEVLHPDDKLLDKIPQISRYGFAFVAGSGGALAGIITTADLSERFALLAGPFLLISEIERRVRRHIDKVCSLGDIQSAAAFNPAKPRTKLRSVHGLTFGDCRKVLENTDIWKRLGWDIDHGVFLGDLKSVNGIRNEVMHFRPDPLGPDQLSTLENFAKWLRRLDPLP